MAVPKYIIQHFNPLSEHIQVWLCPKGYAGTATYLKGINPFCTIRSTVNDDDKVKCGIFELEATINIWLEKTSTIGISEFLATEDDSWRVQVWRMDNSLLLFDGFLVVEDNSEPLKDKPYSIQLKATTGLGKLKGIEFLDKDNEKFAGKYTLLEYIMIALDKVNNELPIASYFNVYGTGMSSKLIDTDSDPLDRVYCFASTFEKDENSFTDCYDALNKILESTKCRLFQQNGKWHIVNLYEYLTQNVYGVVTYNWSVATGNVFTKTPFYPYGVFTNDYKAEIGKGEFIQPIDGDATKYFKLNTGKVHINYNYQRPKETFCNMTLKKGDRAPLLDFASHKAYLAECFLHQRPPYATPGATTNDAYIAAEVDAYDYEKQRFLIIEPEPLLNISFLRSQRFYVDTNDKINISFQHRLDSDLGGAGTQQLAHVILITDGGLYYNLDDTGDWVLTNSSLSVNSRTLDYGFAGADDLAQWTTYDLETKVVPSGGEIEVLFYGLDTTTFNRGAYFKDIRFTVLQYINGSYRDAKGDFNQSKTTNNVRQDLETETYISDAPSRSIKGALVKSDNSLMATEWRVYAATTNYRFSQIMSYILYNHLRRVNYKIEATLKGYLYQDTFSNQRASGFLNQYVFTDFDAGRLFMLTGSYELNLHTGTWRGVFVECVQGVSDTSYIEPDAFKFDYLFN